MKRPEHFVTCGQMKILEQRADEAGLSYYQMMENAGFRAAEFILSKAPFVGMSEEDHKGMIYLSGSGWTESSAKAADLNAPDYVPEDTFTKEQEIAGMAKIVEISSKLANGDVSATVGTLPFANNETMCDDDGRTAGKLAYIFCGKGNNGGDGFVVARLMCKAGWRVTVILVDGEPKTADSITNFGLLEELPVNILDMKADDRALMKLKEVPNLIVDAIYGTGFKGRLKGSGLKSAIYINKMGSLAREKSSDASVVPVKSGTLIFALDIPSGLGGDLTRERELDKAAVRADYTVTFHAKKPVHLKAFAAEYCGEIVIADIGINEKELMHVEIYDEE